MVLGKFYKPFWFLSLSNFEEIIKKLVKDVDFLLCEVFFEFVDEKKSHLI